MKIEDISARDAIGAAQMWKRCLTERLGYDSGLRTDVTFKDTCLEVWIVGEDKFQSALSYGEKVGECRILERANRGDDWDAFCIMVGEKIDRCMKRDEREIRAGLKSMGGLLENSETFTSNVGKMFAERIKAARNEATNFMIEHHGWKPQAAE